MKATISKNIPQIHTFSSINVKWIKNKKRQRKKKQTKTVRMIWKHGKRNISSKRHTIKNIGQSMDGIVDVIIAIASRPYMEMCAL